MKTTISIVDPKFSKRHQGVERVEGNLKKITAVSAKVKEYVSQWQAQYRLREADRIFWEHAKGDRRVMEDLMAALSRQSCSSANKQKSAI